MDVVEQASFLLNDHGYIRWPKQRLDYYRSEGLNYLYSLRPDAATRTVAIPLVVGSLQTLPEEYESLVEVVGVGEADPVTGDPILTSPIVEQDDQYSRSIKYSCSSTRGTECDTQADYETTGVQVYAQSQREFTVAPPVPNNGVQYYVYARVVDRASASEAPLTKYAAALLEWVLYRAKSLDMESQYATREAQQHFERFFFLVTRQYQSESLFFSGAWGRDGLRFIGQQR